MSCQDQPVLETGISLDEIEQLWFLLQEPGRTLNSGSECSNISISDCRNTTDDSTPVEVERKRKRMISNRESARRSRWRKKKQFEDLTDEMQRLGVANQAFGEQLGLAVHRCHMIQRENQRLQSECMSLSALLSNLHQIWVAVGTQHQLSNILNYTSTFGP